MAIVDWAGGRAQLGPSPKTTTIILFGGDAYGVTGIGVLRTLPQLIGGILFITGLLFSLSLIPAL